MIQQPLGWGNPTLLDCSQFVRGVTYTKSDATDQRASGLIPVVRANNIQARGFEFKDLVYVPASLVSAEQVLKCGDVVVATSSGSISVVGKAAQVRREQPMSFGAFCGVLRPSPAINARYFGHFFSSKAYRDAVSNMARGVNINNLKRDHFQSINIPLAPLAEQKRIADKLDTVLTRVDAVNTRLARVAPILKRFRQSVLAAATSGRLTEDWREANDVAEPWMEVCLGDIADVQGGVTKDSKKQSAADEELPYLRVANVQRGYIDLSEVKTIRVPAHKIDSLLLVTGDILFNEGGDLDKLGRGWVWEGQIERCTYQNHVFRARLHNKAHQPKYVSWWGNYRGLKYFIQSGKQTTNLASINKTMLAALPISMPPPAEQTEIVRRVETLFAFADRLEARLQTAQTATERLTPALLAKAFRGELVPQDPNDEPASELLKRLAATAPASAPKRGRPAHGA